MSELKAYTRNKLASSFVGVPAPDRSGEIIGQAAIQSSNQIAGMVLRYAEEQATINNKLDVLNAQADYNNELDDLATSVKEKHSNSPVDAVKEFREQAKLIKSKYETNFTSGRRNLMFKIAAASVDSSVGSGIGTWAVKRGNQLVDDKINNAFEKEASSMSQEVINGGDFEAVDKRLLAIDITLDNLNRGATDPTYDIHKDKKERSEYFVQSYVNQQMQQNPQQLYTELVGGKFTKWTDAFGKTKSLLDSDDIEDLKRASMKAILSKNAEENMATAYSGINTLSGLLGGTDESLKISGNAGSLSEVADLRHNTAVEILNTEKLILTATEQKMPEDVINSLKTRMEMLKTLDNNLKKVPEMLVDSDLISDKKLQDHEWRATFLSAFNSLAEEAGDEPDESYAPTLLNAYGNLLENKEKISVEDFKMFTGKIIPLTTKALKDYYDGWDEGHNGIRSAVKNINNAMGFHVSKDKLDFNRVSVEWAATKNFWNSYNEKVKTGEPISKPYFDALAMDSVVKGLMDTNTINESLKARLVNDSFLEVTDKSNNMCTTIWKDKVTGLYKISAFKGQMSDETKNAIKQGEYTPVNMGMSAPENQTESPMQIYNPMNFGVRGF